MTLYKQILWFIAGLFALWTAGVVAVAWRIARKGVVVYVKH